MNKIKFVLLAHFYLIRMLWNHGSEFTSKWIAKDVARTEHQTKFYAGLGHDVESKGAKRIRRKYAIQRLKEASVKKN